MCFKLSVKVIAHGVRNICMLKNKYDFTLCQSRLHTASETVIKKKKKKSQIRFDFLCFHIHSMHFDRKGWGIQKHMRKFRTQCAMTFKMFM